MQPLIDMKAGSVLQCMYCKNTFFCDAEHEECNVCPECMIIHGQPNVAEAVPDEDYDVPDITLECVICGREFLDNKLYQYRGNCPKCPEHKDIECPHCCKCHAETPKNELFKYNGERMCLICLLKRIKI